MRILHLLAVFLLALAPLSARAQFTNITVFLPDDDPLSFAGRTLLLPRGDYTYRLHVPEAAARNPDQAWPCLFVLAPGPASDMAETAVPAVGDRWVIVEIAAGGDNADAMAAAGFVCAHDDLPKRCRCCSGFKILGAEGDDVPRALTLAAMRSGFLGAVCCNPQPDAAGDYRAQPLMARNTNFMIACISDAETNQARSTERLLASLRTGAMVRLESVPASVGPSLEWMEHLVAFEQPYDSALKEYYIAEFNRYAAGTEKARAPVPPALVTNLVRMAETRDLANEPLVRNRLEKLRSLLEAEDPQHGPGVR